MNKKLTILYSRLSREDTRQDESLSIENQKKILEDYAVRNGFTPFLHLSDDGYSGTQWERPGWQELLDRVERGDVAAVLVKTMDRMGRDYLRVGLYREMFREKGIRLLAVSEGYDSSKGEDDFTPFREIMAEWYARDTSRKIKASYKAKANSGKHVSANIPYGYYRESDDPQTWHIDEEAAAVVRRIFGMIIDGMGVQKIAEILTAEKVLNPSAREEMHATGVRHRYSDPHRWSPSVICTMLGRREYLGHTISCKTYKENFKSKKRYKTPLEQQLVFEDTHPAIIDQGTWDLAQKLRRTVRREPKTGEPPHRLTGLLYCADCGCKLTHNRGLDRRSGKYRSDFTCISNRRGTGCTGHYIRSVAAEEVILDALRRVTKYVSENEDEFLERVRRFSDEQQIKEFKALQRQSKQAKKRLTELDVIIKKLLESNAMGRIPDSHFDKLFAEYAEEQTALEATIADNGTLIKNYEADATRADRFIALVKQYTEFAELSTAALNEFVDKVLVHEGDRSSGERVQQLDVYFNFIGNFDVPPEEIVLTPEEAEEQRKLEEQRAKNRKWQRDYRERKKARLAAAAGA